MIVAIATAKLLLCCLTPFIALVAFERKATIACHRLFPVSIPRPSVVGQSRSARRT